MKNENMFQSADWDWKVVAYLFVSFTLYCVPGLTGGWILFFGLALLEAMKSESGRGFGPADVGRTYAGFWLRTGSLLVDGGVSMLLMVLWLLIFGFNVFQSDIYVSQMIVWLFIQLYTLKRWGQTPGKMVMGIKVLKANYEEMGWKEVVLRNFVEIVQVFIYSVKALLVAYGLMDFSLHLTGVSFLPVDSFKFISEKFTSLFSFWFMSEVVILLMNRRRRALHDFIAGTVVVVEPKRPRHQLVWVIGSFLFFSGYMVFSVTRARDMYIGLAEKGDPAAQNRVAASYMTSWFGQTIDYPSAIEWYKKAADQGDANAELQLGRMYLTGKGVDVDKNAAIRWFHSAAQSDEWSLSAKAKRELKALGEE
jgi:uncharacterized RDD family membrane protein YckC